ncbi:LytR/AlgR family response regulator transcription factor [Polaribacter septentrionalilitoris]|uniref:LytR/AlgR family response regulator transcription factor n=1 Tax=Polaribacter septentrionalilitoris TaxID=2494657 RepID=UPI00135ABDB7|nr:LytTR family DNA-binding domain-containing protein [Polaribacter septentrionalilitoris]
MKKDKLYFLTFLSITVVFLFVASIASEYFIKVSANQLIEVQVESTKREANEVANFINYQLTQGISKEKVINNLQNTISKTNTDSWFISVFNWGGKIVCHPNIVELGLEINSNESLLTSLKEKNSSDDLYDVLVSNSTNNTKKTSEVIYISPIKNSDLIIAANVNVKSIRNQMNALKNNFYLIFLIMGVLVIVLSFLAVRVIGSAYEKQLELKNNSLATEVISLSKLNTDLVSYREKKVEENKESKPIEETSDKERKRILTYLRNELVPTPIKDIAYIYTENTITYVVCFDGKRSTTNASLDDMYTNLDASLFFRANRQFIISIAAIDKIIKYGKSQLKILLRSKTSEEIIISKNKAAEFKQWLNM